jgi:hypothetical protein
MAYFYKTRMRTDKICSEGLLAYCETLVTVICDGTQVGFEGDGRGVKVEVSFRVRVRVGVRVRIGSGSGKAYLCKAKIET